MLNLQNITESYSQQAQKLRAHSEQGATVRTDGYAVISH